VDSFGERLAARARDLGPLCVGIDPSSEMLRTWGRDEDPAGLEFAALQILDAVTGVAVAIKPQVAFFERFGSAGFRVLERLIHDARSADVLVVGDAKRGDIGSTNDGYAAAWLTEGSPLAVDALTVSPYLGLGAMQPLVAAARDSGRGLFVVVASSNDEGRVVQSARTETGEVVEVRLLREIAEMNGAPTPLGAVGAVLGATRGRPDFDLASLGGCYLVPGVGAQGAGPSDVTRIFERCVRGSVLVNVARAISSSGPERAALADAARRWRDDLATALP
jgi:orotidine-5'-phosphate decarboxylase